jgi:chromosome segregation ATPase
MLLSNMKNRIGVIVLVLLCVGLGIALVAITRQTSTQHHQEVERNNVLSNDLVETSRKLDDLRQVNVVLEADRAKQKRAFEELTNGYTKMTVNLMQASNELARSEVSLKASQEETARRDARIAELEAQNQALDKRALELSTAITNLTVQITETKRKLAASEGEKGFLEGELKRLMAEKAELERQFNDLTVLRAQVAKLKEELSIARRLEWIRRGLFAGSDEKGAQKLMQGPSSAQPKAAPPAYDLNVEVTTDGSVKVIPPLTNGPAVTNPPPK